MKYSAIAVAAAFVLLGSNANAGKFAVSCYTDLDDCADSAADLVTNKFTANFPAKQWEIVVIAEFQRYEDGGGVGYAVAGVAPKGSGKTPVSRFSHTMRIDNSRKMTPKDVDKFTRQVYRGAVTDLMEACDKSPTCDVYVPNH